MEVVVVEKLVCVWNEDGLIVIKFRFKHIII